MDSNRQHDLSPNDGFSERSDVGLLNGLLVDARGRKMPICGSSGERRYASQPVPPLYLPGDRIAAGRLERQVVGLLQQMHLVGDANLRGDVTAVMRRLVVLPDVLVIQLDRRCCMTIWRKLRLVAGRMPAAEVVRVVSGWLPSGMSIDDVGRVLCLRLPRRRRVASRLGQTE